MKTMVEGVFAPPEASIEALNKLAEAPGNEVWLMSGLPVKGAMEVLEKKMPKVGLVYVVLQFLSVTSHILMDVCNGQGGEWLLHQTSPN